MTIGLGHYLAVGAILFTLGILRPKLAEPAADPNHEADHHAPAEHGHGGHH